MSSGASSTKNIFKNSIKTKVHFSKQDRNFCNFIKTLIDARYFRLFQFIFLQEVAVICPLPVLFCMQDI